MSQRQRGKSPRRTTADHKCRPSQRDGGRGTLPQRIGLRAIGLAAVLLLTAFGTLYVARDHGAKNERSAAPPRATTGQRTPVASVLKLDLADMQPEIRERLEHAIRLVAKDTLSVSAWRQLAALCDAHRMYACAETSYRRIVEFAPSEFDPLYRLARVLDARGGDPDDVVAMFKRAAELAPGNARVHHRLGVSLVRQGRMASALSTYLRAIELNPNFAEAHRGAGQVLLALRKPEDALAHLQRAVALSPNDGIAHTSLARAYIALGDPEKANDAIDRGHSMERFYAINDPAMSQLRTLNQSVPVLYKRAKQLLRDEKYGEALPLLYRIDRSLPDDAAIQRHLGTALRHNEDFGEAERHLRRALELDPESNRARIELHHVQLEQRVVAEGSTAEAHVRCGVALRQIGSRDDAIRHFERAVKIAPELAAAHYELGVSFKRIGRPHEASRHFQRAAAADPTHRAAQHAASHTEPSRRIIAD